MRTDPSGSFRTQPVTAWPRATLRAVARNPTPWTRPEYRTCFRMHRDSSTAESAFTRSPMLPGFPVLEIRHDPPKSFDQPWFCARVSNGHQAASFSVRASGLFACSGRGHDLSRTSALKPTSIPLRVIARCGGATQAATPEPMSTRRGLRKIRLQCKIRPPWGKSRALPFGVQRLLRFRRAWAPSQWRP